MRVPDQNGNHYRADPPIRNWHHEMYHLLSLKMTERVGPKSPLRLGLPKSDPKIVDWRDGSFWGKKSHEVAGCGIGILRMRNPLPCLVRSCEKPGGVGWRRPKLARR